MKTSDHMRVERHMNYGVPSKDRLSGTPPRARYSLLTLSGGEGYACVTIISDTGHARSVSSRGKYRSPKRTKFHGLVEPRDKAFMTRMDGRENGDEQNVPRDDIISGQLMDATKLRAPSKSSKLLFQFFEGPIRSCSTLNHHTRCRGVPHLLTWR